MSFAARKSAGRSQAESTTNPMRMSAPRDLTARPYRIGRPVHRNRRTCDWRHEGRHCGQGGRMRRSCTVGLIALLACLAVLPGHARAQDSGITALARSRLPDAARGRRPSLPASAFETSARHDRLEGAVGGAGWWRLQPATSSDDRVLLVFHPYSARLTC